MVHRIRYRHSVPATALAVPLPAALAGVQLKIERSEEHYAAVDGQIDAFLDPPPYDIVPEITPDGLEHLYRAVRVQHPDPNLSVVIGDLVHNLRSSLDHLAWQLVLANGHIPDKRTEFPIFLERAEFNTSAPRKMQGMAPAVIAVIEGLQPFQRPDPAHVPYHPLWTLHQLSNQDKHRLLATTIADISGGGGWVPDGMVQEEWSPGALEEDAVVLRRRFLPPAPAVDMGLVIHVDVAVEIPAPAVGHPDYLLAASLVFPLMHSAVIEAVNALAPHV